MPPQTIALPRPGVPADRGLSALGLIMQLAGRTAGAATVLYLSFLVFLPAPHPHVGAVLLILVSCGWRAHLHARAGRRLLYMHSDQRPLATTLGYVQFALLQAIAIGLTAWLVFDVRGMRALGIAGAVAAWPVVLLILITTVAPVPARDVPLAEDRGLEGASLVMMVLGACGALASGTVLVARGALTRHHLDHGWGWITLFVFLMLLARSLLLLRAGRAGAPAASFDAPLSLLDRYAAFGAVTAVWLSPFLLMIGAMRGEPFIGAVATAMSMWLLFAWPSILKRFFQHRQFVELLDGARVLHARAPDAGLTALGWLLAGHAAIVISAVLLIAELRNGFLARRLWSLEPALGGSRTAIAITLAVAALELVCAVALLQVRGQRRLIATVYAALAMTATSVLAWPLLHQLRRLPFDVELVMSLVPLAFQLAIPAATLVLVHRAIAPAAVARYRRPHEK